MGEIIEISKDQYGISLFSCLVSLCILTIYSIFNVDIDNDDDDSDSGNGGLMQPVT